jgi:AraC-like DNA-binding protein
MLERRFLFATDSLTIADVACSHGRGRGQVEQAEYYSLVFIRRGSFVRSADGIEATLDPTLAYFVASGEEQRFDHPQSFGDDCTAFFFSPELVASLAGGELVLPRWPVPVRPDDDLEQRLLLAACRRGADTEQVLEYALRLINRILERDDPNRVASGRPTTAAARRRLVDAAREALVADPGYPLAALSRDLTISVHHLSRIFRELTGHTIARHRMRLRTRAALERLATGDYDLARLAAELGFSDQSHLGRVLKTETGTTPAAAHRLLTADERAGRWQDTLSVAPAA